MFAMCGVFCICMVCAESVLLFQGVYVTYIHEDGPAAKCGLEVHDKLLQVRNTQEKTLFIDKVIAYLVLIIIDKLTIQNLHGVS